MASLALGVKFIPTAGGAGDFTYLAQVGGYVSPTDALVDGKSYRYRAENSTLTEWEFGTGTWSSSINTLSRDTIAASSTGSKVTFTAAPQIGIVIFPEDVLTPDDNLGSVKDADTALDNLGGTATGKALFTSADADAALDNLGGTATGKALFTSADADEALDNLGGTATGKALFTSEDADEALDNLGFSALGKSLVAATNVQDAREIASALTVVRTAATANVSIASALKNGDAVSGVTLATNDLVLLTAQTAPAENGVYVVAASGAASRHASFATYDAHPGCYFSVCEGTGVADTLWRCTSDRGGTLGTTAITISLITRSDYNWIINGDFSVSVRGNTKTPGIGVYGYDRWKGHASGLVQRVYGLPAGTWTLFWDDGGNATINSVTGPSPIVTTWAGGNADIVVPATANRVCLVFGDRGTESNPFQPRPPAVELALCQFYFRRAGPGLLAFANSSTEIFIGGAGGPMRVLPTLTVPTGSGANAVSLIGGGPTSINTINATSVVGTADSFGFWIVGGGSYISGGWYVTVKHVIVLDADA